MSKQVKGVLGEKLGMTQVWDENNRVVPVTVVKAGPCVVTRVRTPDQDGYDAVQLGYGTIDPRRVNRPDTGQFKAADVPPRRYVAELRTSDASEYTVGQELGPDVFEAGQVVDVTGTTRGKGFSGVIKRHGFHGVSASHGQKRNHRKPGSIGAGSTPSRVFKGMKMSGHMGHVRKTVQNLTIHSVDTDQGLLLIKGAVPGPLGSLVFVRSAAKGAAR